MEKQQDIVPPLYIDRNELQNPEWVIDVERKLVLVKLGRKLTLATVIRFLTR